MRWFLLLPLCYLASLPVCELLFRDDLLSWEAYRAITPAMAPLEWLADRCPPYCWLLLWAGGI